MTPYVTHLPGEMYTYPSEVIAGGSRTREEPG